MQSSEVEGLCEVGGLVPKRWVSRGQWSELKWEAGIWPRGSFEGPAE